MQNEGVEQEARGDIGSQEKEGSIDANARYTLSLKALAMVLVNVWDYLCVRETKITCNYKAHKAMKQQQKEDEEEGWSTTNFR